MTSIKLSTLGQNMFIPSRGFTRNPRIIRRKTARDLTVTLFKKHKFSQSINSPLSSVTNQNCYKCRKNFTLLRNVDGEEYTGYEIFRVIKLLQTLWVTLKFLLKHFTVLHKLCIGWYEN